MMMQSAIVFSLIGAAMIWFAGRRDAARDPRLTMLVLVLLAGFPLFAFLPKARIETPWNADFSAADAASTAWIGWLWAAGVVVCGVRLVAALVQLTKWRKRSIPLGDAPFVNTRAELRMLDGLACPMAAGVLRPLILVPASWREWTPALRKSVITHEAAHHARRDPLWRAIAAIACTLHWWNPLVWWMAARLADQCEYACDERVLKSGLPPQGYAGDLLHVAVECRAPATTLAMAGGRGLEARVRRMLAPPAAWSPAALSCLAALAITAAVGLAIVERTPADFIPGIDHEEIRARWEADPFPGN